MILSSPRPVDSLLEQQDAGSSPEVGLRQRSFVSGGTFSVTVAGFVTEEELVLGALEDFRFSSSLFFLFGVEVAASMANAARARVLTPTWADIDVCFLSLFKYSVLLRLYSILFYSILHLILLFFFRCGWCGAFFRVSLC